MTTVEPVNNFETSGATFRGARRSSSQAPRPEMARKIMDVEDALSWAFVDELPKDRGLGGKGPDEPCEISPMFRHADLGTRVDSRNWEPRLPAALGAPHPDALLIEAAVAGLAAFAEQQIDEDLQLAPDFGALGIDEGRAIRRALGMMGAIVARMAKLRRRPFWTRDTSPGPLLNGFGNPMVARWEPILSETASGDEVEHEALVPIERRNGEYPFGAYCPLAYDPDPQSIVDERAEYLAWWGALDFLAGELTGKLTTIAVFPPTAPQRPWIDSGEIGRPPRIFADLSARTYRSEARSTAEAHRALGARRSSKSRGAGRYLMAPRRAVSTASRSAGSARG